MNQNTPCRSPELHSSEDMGEGAAVELLGDPSQEAAQLTDQMAWWPYLSLADITLGCAVCLGLRDAVRQNRLGLDI